MKKEYLSFLLKVLVSTFAVFITAYLLPGVMVDQFTTAIVVAVLLAIFNTLLKPVLIILTIPVTILTLGLFLLVINALIIQLTAYIVRGFEVGNFWWAVLFSVILSAVTWPLELPTRKPDYHDH